MSVRTCGHLKEDGILCGSPALRGKTLCFYHHRDHQRRRYIERLIRANDPLRPSAPLPRTPLGVQIRLYEIMTALAEQRIYHRRAGKLLYAIQQASTAIRHPNAASAMGSSQGKG